MGKPKASKGVEGDSDSANVVDHAGYDGIHPRSRENERVNEMSVPCQDRGPGGHMGELVTSRGVEGDWRCRNDGQGIGYDGKACRMDGTTSGARRDSKRVKTDPLAIEKEGQHERRKRTTSDVPRPSTPLPIHPRRPTEPVDPPRRQGQMKLRPRKISQADKKKTTYRVIQ